MAGPRAVLKFGGDVVGDEPRLRAVLRAVSELVGEGWRFVLCHGGGPQVSAHSERLGITPRKVGGRRVTDAATLDAAKRILAGQLNVDIVAQALHEGIDAVGLGALSARTVVAERRPPMIVAGGGPDPVDFGFVGRIRHVDCRLIAHLWQGGFTPVISTLGADPSIPQVYNINADTVASAIAAALRCDHLFVVTAIGGVFRDPSDAATRLRQLDSDQVTEAIGSGIITGGMLPKLQEAMANLRRPDDPPDAPGVGMIHIVGADPEALRAEAAAPGSTGTVLVP